MKETSFIEQNKQKWRRFENLYQSGTSNPDELSSLFIEITEDLSYARTHYPRRTVRVYLNTLAQQVFGSLYRMRNYPLKKFFHFWSRSLPLEVYRMRKDMLLAFVVFIISAAIGVVSTANHIDYAKVIMGDYYIWLTDANIENNDPMAIYKSGGEFATFVNIFFNNIRVAFFMFITGLIFGIGTLFFLLYNGIMVGTFQSYFYFKGLLIKKSLLYTTFLTIWIHGAFEISAIVLAAAAGFTLGRSLMFPATYTRLQSLQLAARRGLKMMMGLSFFILLAAILEGYLTRHTEMPEGAKLFIILGSFFIMLFIFVFYPARVARKYPHEVDISEQPAFNASKPLQLFRIRSFGEILNETFTLYRRNYRWFASWLWLVIIPLGVGITWYTYQQNHYYLNAWESTSRAFGAVLGVDRFFNLFTAVGIPVLFALLFGVIAWQFIKREEQLNPPPLWKSLLMKLPFTAFLLCPFTLVMQSDYFIAGFLFIFIATFVFFPPYVFWRSGKSWLDSWGSGFSTGGNLYATSLGIFCLLLLLIAIFSGLLGAQVFYFIRTLVEWHIIMEVKDFIFWLQFMRSVFFVIFVFHALPVLYYAYIVMYYHYQEMETSHDLFQRLAIFGKGRKNFENTQWEK